MCICCSTDGNGKEFRGGVHLRPLSDPLVWSNLVLVPSSLGYMYLGWSAHGAVLGSAAIASYTYHRNGENDKYLGYDQVFSVGGCFTTITLFAAIPLHLWAGLVICVAVAFHCYVNGDGKRYGTLHAMWHFLIAVGQAVVVTHVRSADEMYNRVTGVAGPVPDGFVDGPSLMLSTQRYYSDSVGSVHTDFSLGVLLFCISIYLGSRRGNDAVSSDVTTQDVPLENFSGFLDTDVDSLISGDSYVSSSNKKNSNSEHLGRLQTSSNGLMQRLSGLDRSETLQRLRTDSSDTFGR